MSSKNKKSLLEEVLDIDIQVHSKSLSEERRDQVSLIRIFSSDLCSAIEEALSAEGKFFRTSLNVNDISRYRDGTYSTSIKSSKGRFSKHVGYEIISSVNLAQKLVWNILPIFYSKLAGLYSEDFHSICENLDAAQNYPSLDDFNRLKSITDYIKEIDEDIIQVAKSRELTTATLSTIQMSRVELKRIFYNSLSALKVSLDKNSIDIETIAKNYSISRCARFCFIYCQVLEYIISGNLDKNSVDNLKQKVSKLIEDFSEVTESVFEILDKRESRNEKKKEWCSIFYNQNPNYFRYKLLEYKWENEDIDGFMNKFVRNFDTDEVSKKLDNFIAIRQNALNGIEISREDR